MEEILRRIKEAEKTAADVISGAEKKAEEEVRQQRERVHKYLEDEKKKARQHQEARYTAELDAYMNRIEKHKEDILKQKETLLKNTRLTEEAADLTASALLRD